MIYTRQSLCAPIRAEEGITGILCPPNSSTSFRDLPEEEQIGGYPTPAQLAVSTIDAPTLDSEGRCVILEFPAFVLFGVYSPANRDETRDEFRLGFLDVLDARIRNIIAIGKRVFLTGDLNISREEIDAANAEASMRKQGLNDLEFVSTPARRLFNQLLEGGKVFGERDAGREGPVLWDICRAFHPNRKGMFTCWEQKVNARPGNCGARIDYVICSLAMKEWFSNSNIQEGLMVIRSLSEREPGLTNSKGSDHCPVYALMRDKISINGEERDVRDVMNPAGMFTRGIRQREYSAVNDLLPMSGKLIPEFVGRRNIRDMFARKPSIQQSQSMNGTVDEDRNSDMQPATTGLSNPLTSTEQTGEKQRVSASTPSMPSSSPLTAGKKRSVAESSKPKTSKRPKSGSATSNLSATASGQRSLKGFFAPKGGTLAESNSIVEEQEASNTPKHDEDPNSNTQSSIEASSIARSPEMQLALQNLPPSSTSILGEGSPGDRKFGSDSANTSPSTTFSTSTKDQISVHDPVESKESWSKLFTKPAAPRCEGHDQPCITLLSKKPGMNFKRSFWMCSRPLGPSGSKEKNTQWRCQTFIWCSDWNSNTTNGT